MAGAAIGGFLVAVVIMWAIFLRPQAAAAAGGMALVPTPASRVAQAVAAPVPTATPLPGAAPVPTAAPIAPAAPTATPVPTVTPVPTPTPVPNTKAGTVLAFGQEWYVDGLGLTLKEPIWRDQGEGVFCPGLLSFRLAFSNETNNDILVDINSDNWYAEDNRGVRYPVKLGVPSSGCEDWTDDILRANQVTVPRGAFNSELKLIVTGKFENLPTLQWLRVVIPQASRIKDAAWQIDVVK